MALVPDVSDRTIGQLITLHDRTAVVTGGARNIGLAISSRLAEAGARVIIADVDAAEGQLAVSYLRDRGGDAHFFLSDVRRSESVAALADRALELTGHLDVWVNNAGMFPARPALRISDEEWDALLDLNLRSTFVGAREAATRMVSGHRPGVIVNISSAAAFRAGGTDLSHYVASKFGVRGLTQALAVEFGQYGIRVVGVAPTYVERRRGRDIHVASVRAGQEKRPSHLWFRLPLGREAVPDDVARVVLFAASDLAMLVTGSTIAVDAGQLAV